MKLLCISIVVSLLLLCEGKPPTHKPFTTTMETAKTTTDTAPQTTDTAPQTTDTAPQTTDTAPQTTDTAPQTTDTAPQTTPTKHPVTTGMSVCLRFMSDSRSINLFKAPSSLLRLSPNIAGSSQDLFHSFSSNSHSQVTLSPWIPTAQTPPWTSVCLVLDSVNSVLQIFEGGAMRIRKIQPSRMAWSGEPVLDISGLDGQVTDLEVWDYPLKYRQVFSYLQNYMSSGTVLTWSNIVYRFKGKARFEEAFALRRKEPISSSEAQEQPIRSMQGRGQGLKYRKTFDGQRQRRPMF